MNLQVAFIGVFAVIALVLSPICGFVTGNSIGHILLVTVLSVVAFAVLGFGVHAILEMKVPEFLDFLANAAGEYVPAASDADGAGAGGGHDYTSHASDTEFSSGDGPSNSEVFASATPKRQKSGNFGDHIMVENIAIKNEPKLMAEAIRTMLARDDMGEK
ncbi:hypothetical protein [Leptospira kmetyi]|uniref:Uncharacterized protein n=1 Tax=Leptospira kmetyi TaxID=408139 RepID=A0ABX4NH86_9LEPT|nr:hypothetical protein [Leptospira kmetyi]EQA53322.1 hypothetical protein LEP1GSC052_0870 [Leptospira kmetyi serovar Malaysia str. Bejo-Iso9]PJZ31544.1 hypothetical protein CH378_01735 [Leptospira kmetyi]PJZ42597.1 hypothetical protein CH370_05100 [Leptospira kmetyi]TGK13673.1 hypothetical protein EHO62_18245 [Leptospira kmetyi]TGK29158.1 hypothetical protein EHO66_10240 [Leptospira kmetyi]